MQQSERGEVVDALVRRRLVAAFRWMTRSEFSCTFAIIRNWEVWSRSILKCGAAPVGSRMLSC